MRMLMSYNILPQKKKKFVKPVRKQHGNPDFFTYPNELKNVVYKKLDASKKKYLCQKFFLLIKISKDNIALLE